jgi:hypothetical protein
MRHRGLRDLRTFGNLTDTRRARSIHGAYLELAALALQRQRLLQERRSALVRAQEIDDRVVLMGKQAAVLLRYIEHPDPAVLQALAAPAGPVAAPAAPPAAEQGTRAFRQKALEY